MLIKYSKKSHKIKSSKRTFLINKKGVKLTEDGLKLYEASKKY